MGAPDFHQTSTTLGAQHQHPKTKKNELTVSPDAMDDGAIAEICTGADVFDCMDDCLLFSLFRNTTVLHEKGYNYGKGELIEVKVTSTLISRESCAFFEDDYDDDEELENIKKESVFVGQVFKAPQESLNNLREGDLVTSLRKCPVRTKFVNLPVDALISIPSQIDMAEAALVVSTYAPAMGMLFHGKVDKENRFSDAALKGLDILVTGGGTAEADAVVSLALLSGANRVFVLQSKLSVATCHAQSVRVELVSDNPRKWHPFIDRYMDVIVDFEYPKNFDALYGILKSTGRLVCRKPTNKFARGPRCVCGGLRLELAMLSYPCASIYDLEQQIENEHAEMVRDVRYLFRMLSKRRIRPKIDRYITLRDLNDIREHMRRNPGSGAVVCEPWRE